MASRTMILRFSGTWQKVAKRPFLSCYFCQNDSSRRPSGDEDHGYIKHWMLRYSHENGFLSWSRNAAICAGVGATLTMTDRLSYLSFGFIDLGLLFMTIGSLHHICSSVYLRRDLRLSTLSLLWIVTYTSAIWIGYISLAWHIT